MARAGCHRPMDGDAMDARCLVRHVIDIRFERMIRLHTVCPYMDERILASWSRAG
jgi:hypothetical protein